MSHWHPWYRLTDSVSSKLPPIEPHPSSWRSRLRCTLGLHDWHVGRYVVFCQRCYTSR